MRRCLKVVQVALTWLTGSGALLSPDDKIMAILGFDHAEEHVLAEMRLFSDLVTDGQYIIIEDGLIDGVNPLFNLAARVARSNDL